MKFRRLFYDIALFLNGELRSLRYYRLAKSPKPQCPVPSQEPLDIVIPVIEKDLKILPLALAGIRECVQNPVSEIYVVAPESGAIEELCRNERVVFVPESTVFGYTPKNMDVVIGKEKTDRSGWIFQQLLKLSGKIGTTRYFVTIDADHILLQPHTFLTAEQKMVFYQSRENHKAYYRYIAELTGRYPLSAFSYVAHKMIFDKELLLLLHREIEDKWGMPWDEAIAKTVCKEYRFDFSEFELFGNFVPKERKIGMFWYEKPLKSAQIESYPLLKERYGKDYLSVTFPYYLG